MVCELQKVSEMVGMLSGKLFVVGIEENIIRAKNPNEKDTAWYRLTLGDGVKQFTCTCGAKWKVKVAPDKEVEFLVGQLHLFSQYDCTFDVDMSSGYPKLKLRTFKPVAVTK